MIPNPNSVYATPRYTVGQLETAYFAAASALTAVSFDPLPGVGRGPTAPLDQTYHTHQDALTKLTACLVSLKILINNYEHRDNEQANTGSRL